jgi:hypothetical protein
MVCRGEINAIDLGNVHAFEGIFAGRNGQGYRILVKIGYGLFTGCITNRRGIHPSHGSINQITL